MTQCRKSQSIGLLVTIVFSSVLLWALAAMVQPPPVVHADSPPRIETITVTTSKGTYFYNQGLGEEGGTVYFNNLAGEGAGQVITVTMTVTGSMPMTLTGAPAFQMTPIPDTTDTGELGITYTIGISAGMENGVPFTVTASNGLTDTAAITFIRDITDPTVEFTDFTNPDYVDAGGSNWYDPDNLSAGWYFTSTVTDTLSGLALANAFWDHSTDHTDRSTDPDIDGTGVFTDVASDEDGAVTVTLTITDNVSNSASDTVVFNLDNTGPTVISPTLNELSPFLHADGPMLYYGDEVALFWVEGEAQDDGAGPCQATYSDAFEGPPPDDDLIPPLYSWAGYYAVALETDYGNGTITVTVSDQVGNSATQIFTYTRDITSPDISYGSPPIVENSPHDALYADGTTVYYSDQMGGTAQSFTVQGSAADNSGGAGLWRATFSSPDLNDPGDDLILPNWSGIYYVDSNDSGTETITVRVYDNVSNWSERTFNYVEDTTAPTVELTDVTDPGYDYDLDWGEDQDELDDDGSNWYNASDFTAGGGGGGWAFNSYTADDGAGRASGTAIWDHSNNDFDRPPRDCSYGGDGIFPDASGDGEGTVTVTVTIADHVGNSASDTVVFSIDNTKPTIASPYIDDYGSPRLHVNGFTVYCGDMTESPQSFDVRGDANDNAGGVGLHYAAFSSALGGKPNNDDSPDHWAGTYTANWNDTYPGMIIVTVYDRLGNADDETFYYYQDITPPVVDITSPDSTSEPSFLVSWSGNDPPPDASGLNHFDVQYKVESGNWQDWHTNTLLTQDTFGPTSPVTVEEDRTYYFRVRAEDNVSNEQQYTNGDDATTYHSNIKKVFLPLVMAPDPNWGFELGDFTNWQHGGQLAQSVSTARRHSGSYSALLGSSSYACNGVPVGSARLRRSVTVPSSGSPTLSFWYRMYTQDKNSALSDQYDLFAVYINDSQLVVKDANTSDPYGCSALKDLGWKQVIFSLNAYKGQTIEITFYNYNRAPKGPEWYNTYTYIDDVSVK